MSTTEVISWVFAGISSAAALGSAYYAIQATRTASRIKARRRLAP